MNRRDWTHQVRCPGRTLTRQGDLERAGHLACRRETIVSIFRQRLEDDY